MIAGVTLVVMAFAVGASPSAAPAAPADLRARDLFQQQRYADALAIYTDLYARTHHPTYLRNAGRCHQMLRQPEQAIAYFQTYLHDAHDLPAAERSEVEGYIADMQALQRARVQMLAPLPPESAQSETGGRVTSPASAVLVEAPPSRATPVTHRWWFWTAVGAVVVGGVVTAAALASHGNSRLPCPDGAVCPP
ncbi:MAG TPA: tetratricopeptide repeat protein [Acidobacteriaceae bacterium]|nr:tetratricopeptide repeat protein [Acidobacteriaceae bacterium]